MNNTRPHSTPAKRTLLDTIRAARQFQWTSQNIFNLTKTFGLFEWMAALAVITLGVWAALGAVRLVLQGAIGFVTYIYF